ncbi:MAG: L,D-transpeptidase family protein [Phycisphaerales bacterium]
MALPSQNNETRSGVMHQSGAGMSSTGKVAIIALGLVLAVGGIYALWKFMPKAEGTGEKIAAKPEVGAPKEPLPNGPVTVQRSDISNPNTTANSTPGISPTPGNGALLPGATPAGAGSGTTPGNGATPAAGPGTGPGAGPGAGPGNGVGPAGTAGGPVLGATPGAGTGAAWMASLTAGDSAYTANKLVDARREYSRVILSPDAPKEQKDALRSKVQQMNDTLVFSPTVDPTDTLVESYKVQSGDALAKLPRKRELATDYRLIQRINRISNPNALRLGQTIKLVRGPFHAVVNKGEFRVDIYAGSPDRAADWLYIKSYKCGLGEGNSTPVGNYVIKKGSKLVNPYWTNPRTGEKFDKDDPKNPIGEYWLGWQGVGDSASTTGYGFHGTVDPDSIGQQKSMGCVRFGAEDIAQIYELLVEDISVVRVLP